MVRYGCYFQSVMLREGQYCNKKILIVFTMPIEYFILPFQIHFDVCSLLVI